MSANDPAGANVIGEISRAICVGKPLANVAGEICAFASTSTGSRAASIMLMRGNRPFQFAGSHGLSEAYPKMLRRPPLRLQPGRGPSGIAVQAKTAVTVEDTETDPEFAPWRALARHEGFRALTSLPLLGEHSIIGTLNLYNDGPRPWSRKEVDDLPTLASDVASALQVARLIERQRHRLRRLARTAASLRSEVHEHANQLYAIRGLLALGELDELREFLAQLNGEERADDDRKGGDGCAALSGLLEAEKIAARRRGITLELDARLTPGQLPAMLDQVDAVTIIGNLLGNAFDAVASVPDSRRRVSLRIDRSEDALIIITEDHGNGIPHRLLTRFGEPGVTTKGPGRGCGLKNVSDAVDAALGHIAFSTSPSGTTVTVKIPYV